MRSYEARKPSYFATPAVQLVQALLVSLRQILAQTPDINDRCMGWKQGRVQLGWAVLHSLQAPLPLALPGVCARASVHGLSPTTHGTAQRRV